MANPPTVVLIHGLFGFRKLLWIEYFHGVHQLYEEMGMRVLVPSLPWVGSIEQCAGSLAKQLENESGPLHLVAHSMGGLDARRWISCLDGGTRVASLTTLSTPHRGSAASNHICQVRSPFRMFAGAHDLTTDKLERFNRDTPDRPDVIYRSYAATRPVEEQPWLVRHYGRIIQLIEGDNDSQVSVSSAVWGEHVATLPCDHFELIFKNLWLNPFRLRNRYDPMPVYRAIGEWILEH
jgi:triacylglycerol lipase